MGDVADFKTGTAELAVFHDGVLYEDGYPFHGRVLRSGTDQHILEARSPGDPGEL